MILINNLSSTKISPRDPDVKICTEGTDETQMRDPDDEALCDPEVCTEGNDKFILTTDLVHFTIKSGLRVS